MSSKSNVKTTNALQWVRKLWLWLTLAVLVILFGGLWWSMQSQNQPLVPPTAEVLVLEIVQDVQAAGVLQPRTKVEVGAQVSGQVRTVHVVLGQQVRKGDPLVSLDPELARNAVQQAKATLTQQNATLDIRRIDLIQAQRELARQRKMLPSDATTAVDVERAETEVAKLEVDLRGQTAVASGLRTDLDSAQLKLGYTVITAPTDGDVVSINVQEGQAVNAVQQTPLLLTLAKLDTMTCVAQVAEADITKIRVGQEASFVTLGNGGDRHKGQVRVVQPVPKQINGAQFYPVMFDVPNPKRELMSDMTAQVTLQLEKAKNALSIPIVALGDKDADGRYAVRVLEANGTVAVRKVRVGVNDSTRVQVVDGLRAGERVLTVPVPPTPSSAAPSSH